MSYIGIIVAVFIFLWMIVTVSSYILIWIVKHFTCRNVEDCRNRKCRINSICCKYNPSFTKQEIEYLHDLIEEAFGDEN